MRDSTYSHQALRSDADTVGVDLLREVFAATPLAIFIGALNGRPSAPRSSKR